MERAWLKIKGICDRFIQKFKNKRPQLTEEEIEKITSYRPSLERPKPSIENLFDIDFLEKGE